ncbi:MAG: hypothetical protein JXB00_12495 [Bacteroidales bacterium]|nr:hypothetical protein [Bacteroidales bacterium]
MTYKRPLQYLWILIILIFFDGKAFQVNESVRLRIISISWSSKEWQDRIVDTTYIEVMEGENFGGKNSPHYFRLLEVTGNQTIKISFSDDIVVAGEAIAYPSKQNPIVITGEITCFRTRLYDAGTDFCINVM